MASYFIDGSFDGKAEVCLRVSAQEVAVIVNALLLAHHLESGNAGILCDFAERGLIRNGKFNNAERIQSKSQVPADRISLARDELKRLSAGADVAADSIKWALNLGDSKTWASSLLFGYQHLLANPTARGTLAHSPGHGRVTSCPCATRNGDIWMVAPPAIATKVAKALRAYLHATQGDFLGVPLTLGVPAELDWLSYTGALFGYGEPARRWDVTVDHDIMDESALIAHGILSAFEKPEPPRSTV